MLPDYQLKIFKKKICRVLEFIQSQWLKQYVEFNTKKKNNRSRKKWGQRWKSVVKINEQPCIWKT